MPDSFQIRVVPGNPKLVQFFDAAVAAGDLRTFIETTPRVEDPYGRPYDHSITWMAEIMAKGATAVVKEGPSLTNPDRDVYMFTIFNMTMGDDRVLGELTCPWDFPQDGGPPLLAAAYTGTGWPIVRSVVMGYGQKDQPVGEKLAL